MNESFTVGAPTEPAEGSDWPIRADTPHPLLIHWPDGEGQGARSRESERKRERECGAKGLRWNVEF